MCLTFGNSKAHTCTHYVPIFTTVADFLKVYILGHKGPGYILYFCSKAISGGHNNLIKWNLMQVVSLEEKRTV